jgi:hypothetical protein
VTRSLVTVRLALRDLIRLRSAVHVGGSVRSTSLDSGKQFLVQSVRRTDRHWLFWTLVLRIRCGIRWWRRRGSLGEQGA